MKTLSSLSLLALSLSIAACTDSPNSSDLVGIYAVDTLTSNTAACADGGESILGGDKFAFVASTEFFNTELLQMVSCSSIDDCRSKKAALERGELVTDDFSFTVDATALTGAGADTGILEDGVCHEGEVTKTQLDADGDSITITEKITVVPDYPAEGAAQDTCSTDGSLAAADGRACSQQQTLTAHFVAEL